MVCPFANEQLEFRTSNNTKLLIPLEKGAVEHTQQDQSEVSAQQKGTDGQKSKRETRRPNLKRGKAIPPGRILRRIKEGEVNTRRGLNDNDEDSSDMEYENIALPSTSMIDWSAGTHKETNARNRSDKYKRATHNSKT